MCFCPTAVWKHKPNWHLLCFSQIYLMRRAVGRNLDVLASLPAWTCELKTEIKCLRFIHSKSSAKAPTTLNICDNLLEFNSKCIFCSSKCEWICLVACTVPCPYKFTPITPQSPASSLPRCLDRQSDLTALQRQNSGDAHSSPVPPPPSVQYMLCTIIPLSCKFAKWILSCSAGGVPAAH